MQGLLPEAVLERRKRGFNVPMATWLRGELRETFLDTCSAPRLRAQGVFRPEAVAGLWEEHAARRADHSRQLWALLNFSLWHDRYYRN
jgi:asparagine synthase (glutamine-hydrolysing)